MKAGSPPTTIYLLCSLVVLLAACKKAAVQAPPPPTVQAMEVATTNSPLDTEIIGQLDSPQNIEIRARVEGFVDKILFTEGTEVKEGDHLFLLDKKPFEQRLVEAQGVLAEAKAAMNKSEKDVARLTPLAQKRAVPQQDLDNAIASVDVRSASVITAQARVQGAQLDLGYCDIRAPNTGLIGAKQVSMGELVGKGEPTLLATMSTLDPIWFYCAVSEVQFIRAQKDAGETGKKFEELPVTLILAEGTVHPHKGKLVFIDRAVDAKTGTLRIRAEFPNPEKRLRPGMFARIKVEIGVRPNSILVPERAVAELQGKNFVWLVGPDNKAKQQLVKISESRGGNILVLEGLKPGDRIVVEGLQKVREGATVRVVNPAPEAESKPAPAKE